MSLSNNLLLMCQPLFVGIQFVFVQREIKDTKNCQSDFFHWQVCFNVPENPLSAIKIQHGLSLFQSGKENQKQKTHGMQGVAESKKKGNRNTYKGMVCSKPRSHNDN